MKSAAALLSVILAMAQPALALSCLKPDVARSFQDAVASEKSYFVVNGSFQFEPPQKTALQGVTKSFTAEFRGGALTKSGFKEPFQREVVVELLCAGPWCGTLEPNARYIAFVELKDDQSLTLAVDPCFSSVFSDPNPETVAKLESCAKGGPCEDEQGNR